MGDLQGWQADPFKRHEMRYFSRGEPTEFVRDGTKDTSDPLPVAGSTSVFEAASAPTTTGAALSRPPSHRRRRKLPLPLLLAVVLVAALGAVLAVVATGNKSSPPGSGMSPLAFVTAATHTTLGRHSVDIALSGSVSVSGQTVPVHGFAQADFSTRTVRDSLSGTVDGVSILANGLLVGDNVYIAETLNGHSLFSTIAPARAWLEMPIPLAAASGGVGMGVGDPIAQLESLAATGNIVSSLGTSTIDRTEVSGFAVTVNRRTINESIQQAIAAADLSANLRALLKKQMEPVSSMTEQMSVWIDAAGLVRRMTVTIHGFPPYSESLEVTGNYSNYGGTVAPVVAPPTSQVISFASYMQAALSKEVPSS